MTAQDWDINTIQAEEIVEHLKECHMVNYSDRASLNDIDFREEHFPRLTKDIEDNIYGYLSSEGRKRLEKVKYLTKRILKHCEEERIPIARVFDENENQVGEWRICKPTLEQIAYLRIFRWFRLSAGNFCKAMFQAEMLEEMTEKEIKVYAKELQETVVKTWEKKQQIINKKRKKNSI